jgi:CDP-glycerol glycerophosphotransferase
MKFNKKNPKHWFYFGRSGAYILISILMRPFFRKNKVPVITLFGHKLNGNLKAFYDYASKERLVFNFVSIDSGYYKSLKETEKNINVLYLQNLRDVLKLAKSDVIIADRKAHALLLYLYLTKMPFVDVWHGIQVFKKFSPKRMVLLKRYKEIWTSSPALAEVYPRDYGIDEDRVKVTGYARVDKLVNGDYPKDEIKKKYDIDIKYKKIILLAPTWQQDDPKRAIIPFEESPEKFLSSINQTAKKNNALIIFRAHLNTSAKNKASINSMGNIKAMSHNDYPDSEEFLSITDLFIGDWSSIAFDYLPLHKPAIFLDVPQPFKNGLTFEGENRFGDIVGSLDELNDSIDRWINNPQGFLKKYGKKISSVEQLAYGDTLDGKSAERYLSMLKNILNIN